jgi:hypothetical protein
VIRTPIRAPNANAFAEHWVRTVRSDCLDRMIILRRRHLERVLGVYTKHYNEHWPHRALRLAPPNGGNSVAAITPQIRPIRRHDLLGGLIHELPTSGVIGFTHPTGRAVSRSLETLFDRRRVALPPFRDIRGAHGTPNHSAPARTISARTGGAPNSLQQVGVDGHGVDLARRKPTHGHRAGLPR